MSSRETRNRAKNAKKATGTLDDFITRTNTNIDIEINKLQHRVSLELEAARRLSSDLALGKKSSLGSIALAKTPERSTGPKPIIISAEVHSVPEEIVISVDDTLDLTQQTVNSILPETSSKVDILLEDVKGNEEFKSTLGDTKVKLIPKRKRQLKSVYARKKAKVVKSQCFTAWSKPQGGTSSTSHQTLSTMQLFNNGDKMEASNVDKIDVHPAIGDEKITTPLVDLEGGKEEFLKIVWETLKKLLRPLEVRLSGIENQLLEVEKSIITLSSLSLHPSGSELQSSNVVTSNILAPMPLVSLKINYFNKQDSKKDVPKVIDHIVSAVDTSVATPMVPSKGKPVNKPFCFKNEPFFEVFLNEIEPPLAKSLFLKFRLLSEREVLLYCDFHGHSRKSNVFMYGCNNKHQQAQKLHERVFPLMLGKNAPDQFSFQSCKFKVQKSKEGTGRIVMWKLGIGNSYTMESTFGGSTLGAKKGTHFTTEDLKSMGHHFCDTLLDYCDPDSSKFVSCLVELKEILQKGICQKLSQLGRDVSNPSLSDISLSDIESSTSGSNSSESDGLPAHLLVLAEKFKQKKKHLRSRKERNKLHRRWKSSRKANPQENVMGPPPPTQRPKDLPASSPGKGPPAEQQRPPQGTNEKGAGASNVLIPRTASVSSVHLEYRGGSKAKQVMEASVLEPAAASCVGIGETTTPFDVSPDNLRLTYVTGQRLFYQESDNPQGDSIPAASDTFCHRHLPLRSRHQQPGQHHPLVITVIQHPRKAASSRQTVSPIKQHPPPYDPLLSHPEVIDQVSKKENFPALPQKRHRDPADTPRLMPAAATLTQPLTTASAATHSSEHLAAALWAPSTLALLPRMKSNPLNAEDQFLGAPVDSSRSLVPQSSLSRESTDQSERTKNLGTWKSDISEARKRVSGRVYQLPRSTGRQLSDSEDKIKSTAKDPNSIAKVPQNYRSIASANIMKSSLKDSGSITSPMDFSSKKLAPNDSYSINDTPKNANSTKCAPKDATGVSAQKSGQAATGTDLSDKQQAQTGIRPSLLETLKHQLATLGEDSGSEEQEDHP
ncbi:cytosolic carboxypeptidase 2 [Lissotriton helveticus]